ncbi:exocyst complex protein-like protein exo70 [Venturia nashicola]|uniref:Exocyst complex protein EXO70 n=1 Tax=Venturia nashicola TaxID=86259 RepID=A0A4Z1PEB2_9PEZI|nr:exocyst complex protein-like protein exo70 [Venturia nashicola]TLD38782.1 exocyst complex protein-like protein exo70 [Venturia nashicola]
MPVRKAAFAEESAEVEVLYANLEKLKTLTKRIQGSMDRLETSGKSVEEAIAPIFSDTRRLLTTNTNIDKVIDVIERLRAPLDQRDREDQIIRSDPRQVGIQNYIASIDRATRALAGLKASQLKSNQNAINDLSQLLRYGARQLEDVFRHLLQDGDDAKTLEPLHYITKNQPFPTIPEEKVSRLREINAHVKASVAQTGQSASQEYPTAKSYAEIRGDYIAASLRNLALASESTARKTSADAIYRQGNNGLGMYADGLRQMVEAEYSNITPIFTREEWPKMCVSTLRNAINEFAKTLRALNTHIQNNLMTDCFLAFEIMGIVQRLAMSLEKLVGEFKQPIMDTAKPIRETAMSSISKMLDDTRQRVQSLIALPMDGGAHTITADIVTRLQTLTGYLDPLTSVMRSLGDGGWSKQPNSPMGSQAPSLRSFDVGADGDQLFAHYASDTLIALLDALENRARLLLKGPALQSIFIINNIAVIERMIRGSELNTFLEKLVAKLLEPSKKRCKNNYLATWAEMARNLMTAQNTKTMRPPSGTVGESASLVKNLGSKEREHVKKLFVDFNGAFDEKMAKHRSYGMEREVRAELAKEITALIGPAYTKFYDRYHEVDKGKGKYVKYDKSAMTSALASLG